MGMKVGIFCPLTFILSPEGRGDVFLVPLASGYPLGAERARVRRTSNQYLMRRRWCAHGDENSRLGPLTFILSPRRGGEEIFFMPLSSLLEERARVRRDFLTN